MDFVTREDSVAGLTMSNRLRNCLTKLQIDTVGKLVDFPTDQWPNVRNMGAKTVEEVLTLTAALRRTVGAAGSPAAAQRQEYADWIREMEQCYGISGVGRVLDRILREHPGCAGETVLYHAYEDPFLRGALKNTILSVLAERTRGMTREEILGFLPNHLANTTIAEELLLELEGKGKLAEEQGRYIRVFPSVLEYVDNLSDARTRDMVQGRLEGKTLEEMGSKYGLTRERTRQLCARAFDRCPRFREDAYRDWFCNYEFSEEEFCRIFGESTRVFHYLEMACGSNRRKGVHMEKQSLTQMLMDDSVPAKIKRRVEQLVYQDFILEDGVRLPKIRTELFRHVVKTVCREKTEYEVLLAAYEGLLERHGLSGDEKLIVDPRTYENRLLSCDYALWNLNRTLRYYNIPERNYAQLVAGLDLKQYMDKELSTLRLFLDYPELMREYDIRDEYELHSLLRKIWEEWGDCEITFIRMPTICVGKPDRDAQVLDLLLQYAPVSAVDLAQRYEEVYGVKAATVRGRLFACINDYEYQGMYTITQESLTQEQYRRMSEVLTEDFYFLSEIQRLFLREFPGANRSLANTYNIKTLGFQVYTTYAIRKTYTSAADYFRSLLLTEDVVDTGTFSNAMTALASYSSELHDLRKSRTLVEFAPRQFINIRRLEQHGVTARVMEEYCRKVLEFVDRDCYFTVSSLRQDGFFHSLDELYFDEWFYASVLLEDYDHFSYRHMGGRRLLYSGKKDVQQAAFLEWILQREERMSMDELMAHLQSRYGIASDRQNLLQTLKDTDLYYDAIMDTVYVDYDTYFEEI